MSGKNKDITKDVKFIEEANEEYWYMEDAVTYKLEQLNKKRRTNRKIKLYLGLATSVALLGNIVLLHDKHTVNDLEDICPISKIYYDLGKTQKAYEHQINHYYKGCCDDTNTYFEYRPEKYTPPEGYTMSEDGKTCYITEDHIEIYKDGEYFYVSPEGYENKGDKCVNTINANYQCEGIIVSNSVGKHTSIIAYDEEQKKLVKM